MTTKTTIEGLTHSLWIRQPKTLDRCLDILRQCPTARYYVDIGASMLQLDRDTYNVLASHGLA